MTRDWTAARAKCDAEGMCRACGATPTEAAHIIARRHGGGDDPLGICPLCRDCHRAYDDLRLDLLPHLTREEQAHAVLTAGLYRAYQRISGGDEC